jgi:hypothetical protein
VVVASRSAVLSIITGGGKWVEITIPADPLYQHLLKQVKGLAGFDTAPELLLRR